MTVSRLKPCPFCQSMELAVRVSAKGLAVVCNACSAVGPISRRALNDSVEYSTAYAQEYWNMRQVDATEYWNTRV